MRKRLTLLFAAALASAAAFAAQWNATGDTLTLEEADLPYHYEGKVGEQKVIALPYFATATDLYFDFETEGTFNEELDLIVVVNKSNKSLLNAFTGFGYMKAAALSGYNYVRQTGPTAQVNPGKAFTLDIARPSDLKLASSATITPVALSEAGAVGDGTMPTDLLYAEYETDYAGKTFTGLMPVVGSYTATTGSDYYHLVCQGGALIVEHGKTRAESSRLILPGITHTFDVLAPKAGYSVELAISSTNDFDYSKRHEVQEITLPYRGTANCTKRHRLSITEEDPSAAGVLKDYFVYNLYKFTLAEESKVRLRYESDYDVHFSLVDVAEDTGFEFKTNYATDGDNTLTTSALPAGTYYIAMIGNNTGERADFALSLMPKDAEQKVLDADAFDADDRLLTLGKTYYGQLMPSDTLYNSSLFGQPYAVAHYIDLENGYYTITATMKTGRSKEENGLQLFLLTSDGITPLAKAYDDDDQKRTLTAMTGQIVAKGRYKVLVAGFAQLTPRDYTVLVEQYQWDPRYSMRTIPFVVDSTLNKGENSGSEYVYSIHGYQINSMPLADTTIVVKWNANDDRIQEFYFGGFLAEHISGKNGEFTTICSTGGTGLGYLDVAAKGYGDYHLEVNYSDRKTTSTTPITLAELLETATETNGLTNEQILLGAEPSKRVKGDDALLPENGKYYFAVAYKVPMAAGQYLSARNAPYFSDGNESVAIIYKKDAAGTITVENAYKTGGSSTSASIVVETIAEGDEYFVVFTTAKDDKRGTHLVDISVGQAAETTPITLAELIGKAETITESMQKTINFGTDESHYVAGETDFGAIGTNYYAVAYKVEVAAGQLLQTYYNATCYWTYIYKEETGTITKVKGSTSKTPYYEIDAEGTYYVVFFTDEFTQSQVTVLLNTVYKDQEALAKATEITLPYTGTITLDKIMPLKITGFISNMGGFYKVNLTAGQSVVYNNNAVENATLVSKAALDAYCEDPTTATVPTTATIKGNYGAITIAETGDYYLFVPYSFDGENLFSIEAVTAYTEKEAFDKAEELPSVRGKLQIEPSELVPYIDDKNYIFYAKIYKVDLKAGVHIHTQNDFARDYSGIRDNALNTVSHVDSYNFIVTQTDGTHYISFETDIKPETAVDIRWELSITSDEYRNLVGETAVALPATITENIEAYVTPLVVQPSGDLMYMDTNPQRLGNDGWVATIKKNESSNDYEYYKSKHQLLTFYYDGISTTLEDTGDESDVIKVVSLSAGENFIGQAFSVKNMPDYPGERTYSLHAVESDYDKMIARAEVLDLDALPVVIQGSVYDFVMNKCVWYTNSLKVACPYQIALNTTNAIRIDYSCDYLGDMDMYLYYKSDGTNYSSALKNGKSTSISGRAKDDVVNFTCFPAIDLLSLSAEDLEALKNYEISITISNASQAISVTALNAPSKVVVDEYTNEAMIRLALADVEVLATLQNGTTQNMANYTTWTLDEGLTQATGTITLPKGYTFAEGIEGTVTVLVNPVTVTTSVDGSGKITPTSASEVRRGSKLSFTIVANEGYEIKSLAVNGSEVSEAVAQTEYKLTITVKKNTKISVVFATQATGIEQVATNDFTLYTQGRAIVVEDTAAKTTVRIYSITGNLIYAGHITAATEQYQMPTAGLYIVRIGNKVQKAIVK